MTAKNRGSQSLIGAASLRYRMPAVVWSFGIPSGYSSLEEHQPHKLLATGSNPVIPTKN